MDHAPARNRTLATSEAGAISGAVGGGASESIIVYDEEHRILHWNRASHAIYGFEQCEVIGKRLRDVLEDDGIDWPALVAKDSWVGSVRRRTAVHADVELRVHISVLRDAAGKVIGILEHAHPADPPTRERSCIDPWSHRELKASEERYRNLINNIPLPLWQVDARTMTESFRALKASGICDIAHYCSENPAFVKLAGESVLVTGVNDSAIRLLNASVAEDLLGPVRYLFSSSPETTARIVSARFNHCRNHTEEMKLRALDGQPLDVLLFVTFPQAPDNPDLALIMIVDVTAQRRSERHLRKVTADFAHAARVSALGELVTTIAHEVRQPLSVIVTDADTGTRWLDRDEPNLAKVKALMSRIMENSYRANEVISRIQDMTVKRDPVRQPVDVNAVVEGALAVVAVESQIQAITVSVRLDDQLPTLLGDRVQLQQVVVNLLLNSIQAIAINNRETREIVIETSRDGAEGITLSVLDTGGGISIEHLDRVFDGFFSTKAEGIGIGLAICRSIVTDHGGTIEVANQRGVGAMFRIILPLSTLDDVPHQTFYPWTASPAPEQPN